MKKFFQGSTTRARSTQPKTAIQPDLSSGPFPTPVLNMILRNLTGLDLFNNFLTCKKWNQAPDPTFWLYKLVKDFNLSTELLDKAKLDPFLVKRLYIILTMINYGAIELEITHPIHIIILLSFKTGILSQSEYEAKPAYNDVVIETIVTHYNVLDTYNNSISFFFCLSGDADFFHACVSRIKDYDFLCRPNKSGATPYLFAFYQNQKKMIEYYYKNVSHEKELVYDTSNNFNMLHYGIWGGVYKIATRAAFLKFCEFSEENTRLAAEKSRKKSIINLISCHNLLLQLAFQNGKKTGEEINELLTQAANFDLNFFITIFTHVTQNKKEHEPTGVGALRSELESTEVLQRCLHQFCQNNSQLKPLLEKLEHDEDQEIHSKKTGTKKCIVM